MKVDNVQQVRPGGISTIHRIIGNRVAKVAKMDTELMGAASHRVAFDKTRPAIIGDPFKDRLAWLPRTKVDVLEGKFEGNGFQGGVADNGSTKYVYRVSITFL